MMPAQAGKRIPPYSRGGQAARTAGVPTPASHLCREDTVPPPGHPRPGVKEPGKSGEGWMGGSLKVSGSLALQ